MLCTGAHFGKHCFTQILTEFNYIKLNMQNFQKNILLIFNEQNRNFTTSFNTAFLKTNEIKIYLMYDI